MWSAALLSPLPRQAEVEPVRSTLARHLLGKVALLPAAPAQAQTPDTTAPTLSSATANNTTLRLTYNEALDTNSTPEATAFVVEVDESDVSLSATNPVAVSGRVVTLTLANGVGIGKTVKVDYTVPGSNPIQDSAGNDAGALMDRSVTVNGICDRTPAVQTAILGKISGITNCEDVTSSHLSRIGGLNLFHKRLTSLQKNDFDGLSSLEVLQLNNNSLSSLPEGIFDGLISLIWLNLSNNSLSSLHEEIFDGLTSLQSLYLQNNSLRSLPQGLLSNTRLPSLTFLRLGNNGLVCLPRDLAGRPSSIIRPDALRNLPDCYGVSLSVSPAEVSEGSGGESITVTAALKDGNRVKSVATTVTISVDSGTATEGTDFTMVSDFTITIASGSSSNSGTFTLTATDDSQVEESETVKVTGRTSLSNSSVAGTEVSGAEVRINDMVSGICDRTPALQAAILKGVTGVSLCADITSTHLSRITKIIISNIQNLSSLRENDFSGLSYLQTLWLTRNSLSILPENIFDSLSSLHESLDLSRNRLSSLDKDIFNGLSSLEYLYLYENSLSSLDKDIFNGLSSLDNLSLHHISLSSLPGEIFDGLSSLTHLHLYNNSLSSLDVEIFDGLSNLQRLHLHNNSLRSLPEGLVRDLTALQYLWLDGNPLVCLPRDLVQRELNNSILDGAKTLPDCYGVSLSANSAEVIEGSGGESITVTATLTAGARIKQEDTEVTISVEDGTAIESVDFTAVNDFTITVASGSAFGTGTFSLTATADTEAEGSETVKVTGRTSLSNSSVAGTEVSEAEVRIEDPPGVEVNPTTLTMREGESKSYTVVLDSLPSGSVTVTASSGDSGASSISPATLTFTTANWNTAQTVTVTGVEDDDANNETVAISHSVRGYGSVSTASNVTVTVNDDETAGVEVDPTTLTMREGESKSYTVVLDSQPSGSVTVTASSGDSGASSISPVTLTFTTANWNTAQTVTVTGVEDDDANNETVAISHSVRGYGSVSTASNVTVTVNDDETAGVEVDPTTLTMREGESKSYTVVLDSLPSGSVTIVPSSDDSGASSISPATLTFTTANWNTAQTVTVTGVEDDDANNETVAISHSVRGYGSVSTASNVTVTVNDDETAGVEVDPTTLTMREGESKSYTVVLDSQPSGSVTVTASSGDSGASSISPVTLTFTTANWNTAQTVTVTGVEDDDANNETVAISHSVRGYGSVSTASNVTVTVNDDETAGVEVDPTTLTMREGESKSYTVVLDSLPSGSVTIVPSSDDSGASSISPATLTFTTANWNTAQTVTVTGVEDDDANNETVAISHSVRGYGSVSTASNVTVTVNDDETAGVEVDPTTLTMREGQNNTYTVKLDSQPSGSVTVTASSGDSGAFSISPATLTFTTANWNTAQTVTVTGVEDDDANNETVAISHSVRGYGSVSTASNVTVTVNDDETAGVEVDPTTLTMREGESKSYTVVLDSLPSGSVTIVPSSDDSGASSISPATLTFTTANWNTAQTVTVTGVEDDDANNETVAISHSVRGYGSVSTASNVTVTVNDDETAGVEVDPTTLTMREGQNNTYTVELDSLPGGNVTVTPSSDDSGASSINPATLTFSTANWNTAQTVTVTGVEDDDANNETVTISHSVRGYGTVSTASNVTVTVNDDETAGIEISSLVNTNLTVTEGESVTYTILLDTEPSGDVTITPSSDDSGAASVYPNSLTFTTSNWNTAQTVTVTGVEDDDANNETVNISHSVRGGNYDSVTVRAMTVSVIDDDTDGVRMTPLTLDVPEGESRSYTVVLESLPGGSVTITPFSDNSDVRCRPTSLTFSRSNWNGPQTMTVIVGQGDDNEDETAAILHSVRGYGSISSGDTVTVTVRDDDEATGEAVIQAWLPRFGRSVAQQVVERVSRRLQQRPQTGLAVSVAGEQLTNRGPWEEEQGIMAKLLGFETVSEGQLVEGTEFAFSPSQPHGEADADGEGVEDGNGEGNGSGDGEGLAFWGAGDLSSFNGQQDTISLSGDVTTALVGADWQRQRWQAGAALAHSWGSGSYEESSREGRLNANLMGLFPYGRYALNPKLTLWGVVGHGWGRLSLLPEDGEQQSTAIQMSMGAVGLDGLLLDGGGSGLTIRSTADALLLRVNSQETEDLAGIQGEVSRLRLGLEAERPFPLSESGAVLTPSLELALRQDGGDAETGFGLDLAAALLWSDPGKGLEVELSGHTLLSHGDAAFHEKGLAASLAWDPNPSSSLGPSLSLSQSMGASAGSGGNDALLAAANWPELETSTRGSAGEDHQFAARLGYGFLAYRDALLITPKLGVALSGDGATTTLGFSLSPYSQEGYSYPWQLSLERQHSNGNSDDPTTQHSLDLRFSLLF